MERAQLRGRQVLGSALVLVGGVLVIVSGFTDWGKVTPPTRVAGAVTVKGSGIVLGVGIVLLVLGAAMSALRTRGAQIALGVVAIAAGLAAVLITGVAIGSKDVMIDTAANKYAEGSGVSSARIANELKRLDRFGQLDVSVKAGLWLGLVGGILVLAGGIAGVTGARSLA